MDDKLFTDLLDNTKEMVRIEKGEQSLNPDRVTIFEDIDVKNIREQVGLKQQDFAEVIGVSYDLVKSWESNRRTPVGSARKLLNLIKMDPSIIKRLQLI